MVNTTIDNPSSAKPFVAWALGLSRSGLIDLPEIGLAHEAAAAALYRLMKRAQKAGFKLSIASGYRDYERQLAIFNAKIRGERPVYADSGILLSMQSLGSRDWLHAILRYSALPGTSRHHWGTDIDLIAVQPKVEGDVLLPHLFENEGPYAPLKKWMDEHANSFGFHLVYTKDHERKGFQYEPWHYSYLPVSKKNLELYLKLELESILKDKNILGKEYFTEEFMQHYLEEYILGISPELLFQKKE